LQISLCDTEVGTDVGANCNALPDGILTPHPAASDARFLSLGTTSVIGCMKRVTAKAPATTAKAIARAAIHFTDRFWRVDRSGSEGGRSRSGGGWGGRFSRSTAVEASGSGSRGVASGCGGGVGGVSALGDASTAIGFPHAPQNLAPSLVLVPQCLQNIVRPM